MIDQKTFKDIADFIQERKTTQGVELRRGKRYTMVSDRVEAFRRFLPDWSITTSIIHYSPTDDAAPIVVEATIADPSGRVLANGHAEEWRESSKVNQTSAVENASTSAIGRALAAMGIHGGEFASANEMEVALNKEKVLEKRPVQTGTIAKFDLTPLQNTPAPKDQPTEEVFPGAPGKLNIDTTNYSLVVETFAEFVKSCHNEEELRNFWARNPEVIAMLKKAGGDWYKRVETIFSNRKQEIKESKHAT